MDRLRERGLPVAVCIEVLGRVFSKRLNIKFAANHRQRNINPHSAKPVLRTERGQNGALAVDDLEQLHFGPANDGHSVIGRRIAAKVLAAADNLSGNEAVQVNAGADLRVGPAARRWTRLATNRCSQPVVFRPVPETTGKVGVTPNVAALLEL